MTTQPKPHEIEVLEAENTLLRTRLAIARDKILTQQRHIDDYKMGRIKCDFNSSST